MTFKDAVEELPNSKVLNSGLFFSINMHVGNTKQRVISEIFKICVEKGEFVFDNDLVKHISKEYGFGNPFDATKIDSSDELPDLLKRKDYFIVHLGEGKHKFVKGINIGFHDFEEVEKDNIFPWKYRRSILNEFDTSEANILSIAQ